MNSIGNIVNNKAITLRDLMKVAARISKNVEFNQTSKYTSQQQRLECFYDVIDVFAGGRWCFPILQELQAWPLSLKYFYHAVF